MAFTAGVFDMRRPSQVPLPVVLEHLVPSIENGSHQKCGYQ
ncbi:MAG: hypothetical protein QGF62_05830 [Gammaproteobacteria bacterium]|nr:hypothetical protein [Gammaproteobacteria bacterium]